MSMKAFTLVETLVAIAILSIAIIGPFQIVQGVLQSSYIARDQLIAAALAQEGMEYVRQVRDTNFIYNSRNAGGRMWLEGFDGSAGTPDCYTNACIVDVGQQLAQQRVISCGDLTCAGRPLYLSGGGLYNQSSSGTVTRFTRSVNFVFKDGTESFVSVTVSWNYHGLHTVTLVEDLRNWL
ncbi:MAG: seg [Parcubacteria group bacterium]|nr:seg [Parcubacteria group bacterium]